MDQYNVISEISNYICDLLRSNMVPDPVLKTDYIGVCSPSEKGDFTVGIYLYDIRESEEIRCQNMIDRGSNKQQFPPMYLTLYYMVTSYSNSDKKFRYLDDQKILAKALQIFNSNPTIDTSGFLRNSNRPAVRIQLENLNYEEKNKIWSFPDVPYRLSLCFKVYPVELESIKVKKIQRIVNSDMTAEEKDNE